MTDDSEIEWFDRPGAEPVEVHEPSARWAEVAEAWSAEIGDALAATRARVEHVGSTAVPGLPAKPVIDLQVSVPDVDDEPAYRPALESLGLVLRAREPWHRFFRPPAGQPRTVHVHICTHGSDWEREHLLFRDHLRRHPETAASYADLKRHLAQELGHDRLAYAEGQDRVHSESHRDCGPPPVLKTRSRDADKIAPVPCRCRSRGRLGWCGG